MKKILLLALLFTFSSSYAQDCSNYYYMQNNKTVEMSIFDKKGAMAGRLVYSISDVTNSNSMATASVKSEMFDKKGRTIAKGSSVMLRKTMNRNKPFVADVYEGAPGVLVRGGTSDWNAFKQVFIWKEYGYPYPFEAKTIIDPDATMYAAYVLILLGVFFEHFKIRGFRLY